MIGAKINLDGDSLPDGWSVQLVGNLGEYINGYPFKPTEWKERGLPIVRIQNLTDAKKPFNYFPDRIDDRYLVRNGDILISWSASLGTFLWHRGDAWLNQHIFKALPDETKIDRSFFYWAMVYAIDRIAKNARGSTMVHVTGKEFKGSEILLPTREEQRKIAAVLTVLRRAIEQQERLQAVTAELKKALLHRLFTRGFHGELQKQSDIGPVPESWSVVRLGEVCTFLSGGTPSKQRADFWEGDIPWVSPKDMKRPRLSDVTDHISKAALEDGSSLAPAGSVFVVVRGMILAKDVPVALAEIPMAFNQDMKAIIPGPKVETGFLLYAMGALKQNLFQKVGRSAHGTMTLMSSEIANFAIPLPDNATQKAIATAIESVERKYQQHQRRHACLTALFRSLLHQLMMGQIRVDDLDVPELEAVAI